MTRILFAICLTLAVALMLVLAAPREETRADVFGGHAYNIPEPEIIQRTIKEIVTEYETIYIPDYKEWASVPELRSWLNQNDISNRKYVVDLYDCEDFAIDLAEAAAKDGYYIGLYAYPTKTQEHMVNFAIIGNDVYKINPQNDYCVKWERLD